MPLTKIEAHDLYKIQYDKIFAFRKWIKEKLMELKISSLEVENIETVAQQMNEEIANESKKYIRKQK